MLALLEEMYYELGLVGCVNKNKYAVEDKAFAQGGGVGDTSGNLETLSAPCPRKLQVRHFPTEKNLLNM